MYIGNHAYIGLLGPRTTKAVWNKTMYPVFCCFNYIQSNESSVKYTHVGKHAWSPTIQFFYIFEL